MCFNNLSLYRKAIYKQIDQEFDCEWYIEKKQTTVKAFPETELKNVKYLPYVKIGPFHWIIGLVGLVRKDYDVFFMLGETRNLSLFFFCLIKKIFYPYKRVYFWTHGYYGKESKMELTLWKRPLFQLPDGLFTYGDYAKRIMVEDGFDEKKIFPIHNSLDYDTQLKLRKNILPSKLYEDHFGNNNPVVVFIGRLTQVKRLDMLVDAIALLKDKEEKYNVAFIGDGIERKALESMVTSYGMSRQFWFYGECYDEKMNAEFVYNADLCVAPGNIGLTAIHVMMFGCPALSHDNFSLQMPEFEAIKPKITGDFYKYGSSESLAETISNWFNAHQKDRDAVRQACYKEIDTNWNPYYQMNIINNNLK